MGAVAAEAGGERVARCAERLIAAGTSSELPASGWWVPGRVELLGKHTDYAGGRSLTCATERGFCAVAVDCQDRNLVVHTGDESARFPLFGDAEGPREGWRLYPSVLARRVVSDVDDIEWGAEVAFESDLPPDAGLSSSSALLVLVFQVLARANGWQSHPKMARIATDRFEQADYAACVESGRPYAGWASGGEGVGTRGGSEDHVAILCSTPGEVGLYSYQPVVELGRTRWPEGWVLAIGGSGIGAHKAGNARDAYNRASDQVAALCTRVGAHEGLGAWLAASPGRLEQLRADVRGDAALTDRLEHFVAEDAWAADAYSALASGDIAEFARVANASHALGCSLLRNTTPETEALAVAAVAEGAVAASTFGAGFGGSVWALVAESRGADFLQRWAAAYGVSCPHVQPGEFFFSAPGPAAHRLALGLED